MRGYWSDTRANGQPVEAGTVCWVSDLEDGSHPIYTYGATQAEVLTKLAQQNMNAQAALAQRPRKPVAFGEPISGHGQQPPAAARAISPDQVMQATVDLKDGNPAKAGAAVATLFESATGVNPVRLAAVNFSHIAEEWQAENPSFYDHPGNVELLTALAVRLAGGGARGLASATKEHLSMAYEQLSGAGKLFERAPAAQTPTTTLNTFPGESQVQRTERPRGSRYATAARANSFRPAQGTPPKTLKYTEEQIRTMPLSKSRELVRTNDREYAEACEHYFGGVTAAGPA